MENHQPFRLTRILEQQQYPRELSLQKAIHFLLHDKKIGDAPCLAGRSGTGRRVYENAQRDLRLGANRQLSVPSQKPKSSMARVMRACLDFAICSNSPSLQPPYRT